MPRSGDIVWVDKNASVQFVAHPILFRVIRVLDEETRNTYTGWAWLDGYQLGPTGDAVERREIFIQPAGLRLMPHNTGPVIPRPRPASDITTSTGRSR